MTIYDVGPLDNHKKKKLQGKEGLHCLGFEIMLRPLKVFLHVNRIK